jgi:hypothetical protein
MSSQPGVMSWFNGYSRREPGETENTFSATYRMVDLIDKGYVDAEEGRAFLEEAGLNDFLWEVTWPEDFETPDEMLENRLRDVQGYAIFIHGWTGNHSIWEELPGLVVSANRRLVYSA